MTVEGGHFSSMSFLTASFFSPPNPPILHPTGVAAAISNCGGSACGAKLSPDRVGVLHACWGQSQSSVKMLMPSAVLTFLLYTADEGCGGRFPEKS